MINTIHNSLRNHAIGMIVLSTIQYILGEFISLFIIFPTNQKDTRVQNLALQQVPLVLHIIVGVLLLIGSIALLIRALIYKNKIWIIASFAASIAVFGAAIAGITFIPTQTDTYSFIMAIYFLFALFAYFWGLYQSK